MNKREKKFLEFLPNYFECRDPDFDVEMKWIEAADGDTHWHSLFDEPSMGRYGLFPYDADYRTKGKK